jgi:hypothetical protein
MLVFTFFGQMAIILSIAFVGLVSGIGESVVRITEDNLYARFQ